MKRIYLLLAILLGSLQLANAQQQTLQFNKDGKFKIVQFTDVHYIYNDPRSDVSIERINQVLDMEKPDLVLFTGDVRGVFVGHDHDDDYAVSWKGILLAYGRYTGGNTVYNHLTNGARVIELDENANSFRTWIRLKEGVVQQVTYPADFIKE